MFRRFTPRPWLSLGLLAALVAAMLAPTDRPAAAQPAAPLPVELQYVPADAAIFVHADAAKVWGGALLKGVRQADPATFGQLTDGTKAMFGLPPDAVKTITAFWPKLKGPQDLQAFGVVLTFNAAYDKKQLQAGLEQLIQQGVKVSGKLATPSDRVAVWTVGLEDEFAKPRPANQTGPLAAAIREAATGKHTLVAASALASLPDEIRGDDLPQQMRPFQSLLRAETITGIIDLGTEIGVEVRVKTSAPAKAVEAEKALGLLADILQGFVGNVPKELEKGGKTDPAAKDMVTILKAAQTALKGAKFVTTGDETRASAKMPADLPFVPAYLTAKAKVRDAAARQQSFNNLKQIGLAMHSYADTMNGTMPPAAVCDKTGKPLLSWRVLILPYIEQDALYKEFKLDEPWDSDHNKKLIPKMPKTYALATPTKAKAGETHYRVFVGKGAAFDTLKGPRMPADFADGTSNTILAVTAADPVVWTKPDDLTFDPEKDMTTLLGFFHTDTCPIGLADGSVRSVSKSITKITLNAAITRNGGEVLGDDF